MNLIFDRTFFTEQVYAKLDYKEYNFDDVYERLVKKLNDLDYNIYFVVLYLNDRILYKKRLMRQHHQYQEFRVENSVSQQNAYLNLIDNIEYENIHKIKIAADDYQKAYDELINKILVLKESNLKYTINN